MCVKYNLQLKYTCAVLVIEKKTQINSELVIILILYHTPHTTKGVYWFHSVHPSVRPSVPPSVRPSVRLSVRLSIRPASRVHSVAPTVLVGSISYLHILSSTIGRCVTCKVSCKISKFVLFWHGIWCESLVWVIMGRPGVSQNAGVLVVLVFSHLIGCNHVSASWVQQWPWP